MDMVKMEENQKRKRTQTNFYKFCTDYNFYKDWTHKEKIQLMAALRKFGHLDIENLRQAVPTKRKDHIKMFINYNMRAARYSLKSNMESHWMGRMSLNYLTRRRVSERKKKIHLFHKSVEELKENETVPLESWLTKLEKAQPNRSFCESGRLPIARAFLYISKYETHPDPSECNGVDFRALYEFLYHMLLGYPAKSVSPPTARMIIISLRELAFNINYQGRAREVNFLDEIRRVSFTETGEVRQYKGPRSVKLEVRDLPETCMRGLRELPGFNPFRVPLNILRKDIRL